MVLRRHSIELAVRDGSDPEDRKRRWEAARDHAVHQLSGSIQYNMTLRLGDQVPIRLTERRS